MGKFMDNLSLELNQLLELMLLFKLEGMHFLHIRMIHTLMICIVNL